MKKYLILLILLFFPTIVFAISDDYKDNVADIVNVKVEKDKINLYLFHSEDCAHCAEERKWLDSIEDEYKDYLNIYMYEVTYDKDNRELMNKVIKELDINSSNVPLTIIGNEHFTGYSVATGSRIENTIKDYIGEDIDKNNVKLPILGNVNMKSVSIPLVAVVLGFIDGFNPCAMWILLFLINMFFGMKDRKKAWILGMVFLFISGLVYFLSMLGINFVLSVATVNWIKILIGIFILVAGILNMRKYLKTRKEEAGCVVVDDKKRKKITTKVKNIMNSKTFILALFGVITLAVSVNLIELACSLGFPLIFT